MSEHLTLFRTQMSGTPCTEVLQVWRQIRSGFAWRGGREGRMQVMYSLNWYTTGHDDALGNGSRSLREIQNPHWHCWVMELHQRLADCQISHLTLLSRFQEAPPEIIRDIYHSSWYQQF